MTDVRPNRTLIGYRHETFPPGANSFPGTALIDGHEVTHTLSLCVQPDRPIDIGRSSDGELVWVSEFSERAVQPDQPQLFVPFEYSPEERPESRVGDNIDEIDVRTRALVPALAKYRKPALFAAGAVVMLVGVSLFLPQSPSTSEEPKAPSGIASEQTATPELLDPASAAISFVLKGDIAGLQVPPDANASDFSATVVSQSGEIVLVDVLRNQAEGITTFATLLLQKSGTAWRIREVFDPR